MSTNIYDVGDMVLAEGHYTDADGILTDPTVATLKVKNPAGTTTTYVYGTDAEVTRVSTGRYQAEITVTAEGNWYYRWEGTGAVTAGGEKRFIGRASEFY